ncbi:unnamed protein product [Spodoptera exigua]|nr:unnamed protein product [Spodoptera exigua]
MSVKVEKATEPLLLGEGPHWDEHHQALFFVNIQEHTIHKYVPATGAHTKTKVGGRVGFIVPVEGTTDQFLVGVDRKFQVIRWDGADGSPATVFKELVEVDSDLPTNRINDGKADPKGRVFAGTMGHEDPPGNFTMNRGNLFRLEGGKVTKVVSQNKIEGFPDGTTIDTDGNLWVAVFDGSCVLKINPRSGELLQKVSIPALQVTSARWSVRLIMTKNHPVLDSQPPLNLFCHVESHLCWCIGSLKRATCRTAKQPVFTVDRGRHAVPDARTVS